MNPLIRRIQLKDESVDPKKINPVITLEDESIDPETHRVVLYKSKPVISI
jgi:hypothetical protein